MNPRSKAIAAVHNASQLAQVQAVPHDHAPMRLPTLPNIERTSVLQFTENLTMTVPSGQTRCVMLLRTPDTGVWVQEGQLASQQSSRFWTASFVALPLPHEAGESIGTLPFFNAERSYTFNVVNNDSSEVSPAAWLRNYPLGCDRQNSIWFYHPGNGNTFGVRADLTESLSTGAWKFVFDYTPDFSTSNTFNRSFGATANGNRIYGGSKSEGGWYRLSSITCTTTASSFCEISALSFGVCTGGNLDAPSPLGTTAPIWVPGDRQITASIAPYVFSRTRATAKAALFQNATAALYKDGTVQAFHLPVEDAGLFNSTFNDDFPAKQATLSPINRYYGLMEKGFYGFTRPDGSSQAFRDWTVSFQFAGGTDMEQYVFQLDAFDYVDVVRFTDLADPAAGPGGGGTTIGVTVDTHVEFRNTTSLWPTAVAHTPVEQWHAAQVTLADIPNFYENPVHLATIARLAYQAARWAAPIVAPYAKQALRTLVVKGANKALAVLPRQQLDPRPPPQSKPKPKAKNRPARKKK